MILRARVGGVAAAILFSLVSWAATASAVQSPRSTRLIVELESPPLVRASVMSQGGPRRYVPRGEAALPYRDMVRAEQDAVMAEISRAVPGLRTSTIIDEHGDEQPARFDVVLNAVVIEAEDESRLPEVIERLRAVGGVKAVHRDRRHSSDLHASLDLVNASAVWNHASVGGRLNAGAGVKLASMDGGIHNASPMFSGTGFSYPSGYPVGFTSNTNGKIIASRAYFRPGDPPAAGDENPWPGVAGTSHGVHTASIAAGNQVSATYLGLPLDISGVAPGAWVMSYRVFYESVTGDGSFYTVEGLAALEDIVLDGADIVNNSWGGGPGSTGGEFDALDQALINASDSGVFVAMSAGNAGPGIGTGDHPSSDYISVAATTTDGTLVQGRFNIIAPQPVPAELQNIAYAGAAFGSGLPAGTAIPHDLITAASVGNALACTAFTAGVLTGKLVVIERGSCEYGLKVLNAQNAGAVAAIVHNSSAGGDSLVTMTPGASGGSVTIPAAFVGYSKGVAIVNWYTSNGAASRGEFNTVAYDAGNTPDRVIDFSSRGPSAAGTLKPDIAAPGVNILAQGYTPGATGEARHFGYGQISGTSMAAPHVAGAAAVLRQIHPGWSNAWIKSALMSTSKYIDVFNMDGSPAQPLDMGAGRLDLTKAADPGVILDPPSLTFPATAIGTTSMRTFQVTSVAAATETYTLSTAWTGGGFGAITSLAGATVTPPSLTLNPGQSATVTVSWNSSTSHGIGDNQGFVVLTGNNGHNAHLPVWMRVVPVTRTGVLLIDNDGSSSIGTPDYRPYYASALTTLGVTHQVFDVDAVPDGAVHLPNPGELAGNRLVIYQTGDHYIQPTSLAPPTLRDEGRLIDFVNSGGRLIAFGQDLASLFYTDSILHGIILGSQHLQDAIGPPLSTTTAQLFTGVPDTPFAGMSFDISARGDGARNQEYVDEIRPAMDDAVPVLLYAADNKIENGYVAMLRRDEPTLERRGVTFRGKALFFTFGLEGLNNDTGVDTREELLAKAIAVVSDTATGTLATVPPAYRNLPAQLTLSMTSTHGGPAVQTRWDFGDGSPIATTSGSVASHVYAAAGTYTVAVEGVNSLGTRVVTEQTVTIPAAEGTVPLMGSATATSASQVAVTWTAVPGTSSEVHRSSTGLGGFALIATVAGSSYNDTAVVANTSYLYKIRAVGGASFSAIDAATTIVFSDPVLTPGITAKLGHLTQLRTAVNAMRSAAGLAPQTFTDAATAGLRIKAAHLQELRNALDQARTTIGLAALVYTNSPLVAGQTTVKAMHVTELRNGVK